MRYVSRVAGRPIVWLVIWSLVSLFVGGTAEAATGSTDRSIPILLPGRPVGVHEEALTRGAIYSLVGKSADGGTFSFSWSADQSPPREATLAVASAYAYCSYFVSNIDYLGSGNTSYFYWETSHTCGGAFGTVTQRTRVVRSSWRGWLGYSSYAYTSPTSAPTQTYYWTMRCNFGRGWYDYKGALAVFASAAGYWSPEGISNNTQYRWCGPNA